MNILADNTDFYDFSSCKFVFRNYYRPTLAINPKVTAFALGYKSGFWEAYAGKPAAQISITDRLLAWSFAGTPHHPDRSHALREFTAARPFHMHLCSYFGAPDALSTQQYRDLILQSKFVPCPVGHGNLDTFRIYETMEAGAVPVTLARNPLTPDLPCYWAKIFGQDPPFIAGNSFTYTTTDGIETSNAATVAIAAHDRPLVMGAPGVIANDQDADNDDLTASMTSGPNHGAVALNTDGSFTYTPVTGYLGPDSFQYKVNDGHGHDSNIATVFIQVTEHAVVAANDSFATGQNTALTINAPGLLANDYDPDFDAMTATKETDPAHGAVIVNSNGSFTYTPDPAFVGVDSFTYKANDGLVTSNTSTVTLRVGPDIAVNSFYADGTNLMINYNVSVAATAPYSIAIYAYSDGAATYQELCSLDGGVDVGYQTLTFRPSFDDWQNDYRLIAIADPDNNVAEFNEANNSAGLEPTVFVISEPSTGKNILHIHGTDAIDTVSVTKLDASTLRATLNGYSYDYPITAIDEIHFRGHGGDDTFNADSTLTVPMWLFGGDGNDNLTAGAAADFIFGGAGNDSLSGGDGNDLLDGGDDNNSLDGGQGDDDLYANSGDNTILGGDGSDTISAGNGNNTIQAGDGNDYTFVGDGNNSIDGGDGDDVIATGSGDNTIDGGDGNDEINGLIDWPTIELGTDSEVLEGTSLSVVVWLSAPTDHDVTATLFVQAESPSRWQQAQVSAVVPAGQGYAVYSLATADDELMNGTDLSTVTLVNPDGADLGNSTTAPITVVDNDEGIGLDWDIPVDPDSDSSFSNVVRATTNNDGSLSVQGFDNHGRSFQAQVTINRDTVEQTIDLTINGLPTGDDHWTGTSVGHEEWNGRFPMASDSGNGSGHFAAILAPQAKAAPAVTCRIPPIPKPGPPPLAKSTTVEAVSDQKGKALNDFGKALSVIKWSTPIQNGWIVQHVKITENVQVGNIVLNPIVREFWEGWQIVNGEIYTGWKDKGAVASPKDAFNTKGSFANSCGNDIAIGKAKVMQNYDDEVKTWVKVQESGQLPSTGKQPKDWSDDDTAYHELVTEWNDIDLPKKKTVIVRESP